jgi:hypothetical protein
MPHAPLCAPPPSCSLTRLLASPLWSATTHHRTSHLLRHGACARLAAPHASPAGPPASYACACAALSRFGHAIALNASPARAAQPLTVVSAMSVALATGRWATR